jgi:outer membrane protein assembly factor BamD
MRKFPALIIMLFLLFSCGKKEIPQMGPFDPEAEFAEANRLLEKKDFTDARLKLHNIRRKDVEVEYAPLAQLRVADSYVMEKEPEIAVEEYERFLKEYPRHKYASYAQYQIGLVYYELITDVERGRVAVVKALEAFETLNRVYPRNPYRERVLLSIEHCRGILADYEFMVGEFYFRKKAYKGALARFLGLLRQYPDYNDEAKVLRQIALSYRMLEDETNARRYLDRLIEKYPDTLSARKAMKEFSKPQPRKAE